ncbi:hypothetical protein [uncultured Brachyspira sp.]|jgi:hypothetical protein|uniref:hypothetical protein n=1 Tax=uncultured Brachyspira sp. TaxID=221953 RepID=UPI00258747FF|nr:hypothetical protein [uncultured Brachyspira sp.]
MRFNRYNLIEAVKNNDINKINYILKSGKADINIKNNNGKTALDLVNTEGIKEVLRKTGAK